MLDLLTDLEAAMAELTEKTAQANTFLTDQQAIQQLLTDKEELSVALAQLKEEQIHIKELHQAIKRCEEAKTFEPLLVKLKENQETLVDIEQKQIVASQQLQTAQEQLQKTVQDKETVAKEKTHQEKRKEQLIKLTHLKQSIESYASSDQENKKQEDVVENLQKKITTQTVEQKRLMNEKRYRITY